MNYCITALLPHNVKDLSNELLSNYHLEHILNQIQNTQHKAITFKFN